MGRTVKDFVFNQYPQGLVNMVHDYLISEGYKFKEKKGEQVYQKGAGLMMGPTFIKLTIMNNGARLEGWQKSAILPGVYAGEIDIDSFVGVAVKGPLKKRFRTIEEMIIGFGGMPAFPGMMPGQNYQQPQMPQGGYQQPMYQQPPQQFQPQQPAYQPVRAICPRCGSVLAEGTRFCMSCGEKVQ